MVTINGVKTTQAVVFATLNRDGISIRKNRYKEFEVKLAGWKWSDARVYFTDDLDDAFNTANLMLFGLATKPVLQMVDDAAIGFIDVNSPVYDRFNESYCAALLSTKANSPERVWIVENTKAFELVFFAGYNASKGGR